MVLAVVAAVAALAINAAVDRTPRAAAAVAFHTSGDNIVATVVNPHAAARELNAAFAAHNLNNIDLRLVPVPVSMVGSVVYMGTSAGASDIVVFRGASGASGGLHAIALRIPIGFKARAHIVLGRAAMPGEIFVSAGGALDGTRLLEASADE